MLVLLTIRPSLLPYPYSAPHTLCQLIPGLSLVIVYSIYYIFLKSLNGVFVNGQKLSPNSQPEIKPGDRICFGVAIEGNVHEFDYLFEMAPCVRKRKLEIGEGHDKESKVRKILKESGDNSLNSENLPGPSGENLKVCGTVANGFSMPGLASYRLRL